MKSLLLALQFLTVFPIRIKRFEQDKLAQSTAYFPFAGLLLGVILVLLNNLLSFFNFPGLSINIILIVSLIFITGGIHLDGLSDSFDAFLSGKNKDEMLKIMRDSHMGVMGALSVISIILLKIAFLNSITGSKMIALVMMCILSRWSMVFSIFLFPYVRESGKAKAYKEGMNLKIFTMATIVTLLFLILLGKFNAIWIFVIILITSYLIGKFISKNLGGMTGDTLGALNELTEVIVLFNICIIERIGIWII